MVTCRPVFTTDGSHMHLVTMGNEFECTCRELQEMQWPCEHMMAWDDHSGRDFTIHFHPCWKVNSICHAYSHTIPCFLDNDLELSEFCCPPKIAVKKGRHRVVRIESGGKRRKNSDLGEDETLDASGHLLVRYPIADDPHQMEPLGSGSSRRQDPRQKWGRKRPAGGKIGNSVRCSKCGQVGHNRRTCKIEAPGFATDAVQATISEADNQVSDYVHDEEELSQAGTIADNSDAQEVNGRGFYGHDLESQYDTEGDGSESGSKLVHWRLGTSQRSRDPEWMAQYLQLAEEGSERIMEESCPKQIEDR
ncbi:unnamed protein product [Calypogeia fissa]